MKVLHVICTLDPSVGGPPVVASCLAAAEAALGADVGLVSYRAPQRDQANVTVSLSRIPHLDRVTMHSFDPLDWKERTWGPRMRQQLEPLLKDVELAHLHSVWDPPIFAAAGVCRRLGVPYVQTPHGMLEPWALSQKRLKKWAALRLGYRDMLSRAALLHFLNDDERRLAEHLGLATPTAVIPNGVFLEEFDPLPPRGGFRATRPELGDRPVVFFLSRLHYKKGLDYLADAFAIVAEKIPEAQLVVAGPDGGVQADFEAQIKRLGIADRVHLVGPIYGPAKIQALIDCDCFCLPSRAEGFSVAVTEALACRVPVVISEACHFPEVRESGAGVVSDLNAEHIAAGIERVLSDRAAAAEMGRRGRELVVSRFTWPAIAGRMLAAYERAGPRQLKPGG